MSPSIKWNQHIFLCGAKGLVASTVSSEEEVVSCSGGSKEATKNCEQAATCTAAEDVMEEIAIAEDGMEEIAIDPPAIAIAEDRMEEIAIGPPADEESIIDKTIASYSLQQANVEIETSPISTTCTTSTNSSFSRPLAVVLVTNYVDASYILLPYGMILLTKYSLLLRIPPTECLMLLLLIDLDSAGFAQSGPFLGVIVTDIGCAQACATSVFVLQTSSSPAEQTLALA
eukprot:CAMPEP_0172472532 /NCGR_PEP_ID=MMETSP1065-20121228/68387_1 /TAXON_ID=265537 /ORGANISM="Amphiprora paludosa, Strain CCMP125" /LENGTH=228 /DNA_ID=CAMNT_0013230677 /DNA_START=1645 /DNA_END=2332 /DNA_ORIENTATION=+